MWQRLNSYTQNINLKDLLTRLGEQTKFIETLITFITLNNMENYLNLFEHIPEDEHNHISNKIWEALDRAGIELSQDAELSIRIYDDELTHDYLDSLSEGYDTKVDALVDSMGVSDKLVSQRHERRDLDAL